VCVGEEQVQKEGDSLAKAAEDIGYDDISDDELDDLIEAAEDEQDEKPTETIGTLVLVVSLSSSSPTTPGCTTSPAQLLRPTGFLSGWSVGLEFPAGQLAESNYWREQFQTIPEDISVCNVLMHSAH